MKRSILVVVAVLLVAGVSGIADAETKGNIYTNKFVGLSFPVPEGWYIATDNETKELMPEAARVMGLDDPVARATVAQMPGKVLLMVSEAPLKSDVQTANRNIIFAVINAREIKKEVGSGAEYLRHVARGMSDKQPAAGVSDITTQHLGGVEFHRLNMSIPMQGMTVHMCQLARLHNDYILILNFSADTDASLAGLLQVADNLRLSAPSQALDTSKEGKLFRDATTIKVKKSGWNLLQLGGVILIGIGLFFVFRPLGIIVIVGALIYYFSSLG